MGTALNVEEIVEYYDHCQVDYEEFWHLNAQLCMHYGFGDQTTPNLKAALSNMNAKVAAYGGIEQGDDVLDAGCGVGGSSIFLASQLGCNVTGISLSSKQIDTCRINAANRGVTKSVVFDIQNYQETTFPDNTFGVVWGVESVCYANDKINFLREAFRILKPGGRLIVADFFSNNVQPGTADAELMRKWTETWAILAYADIDEFRNKITLAGFTQCKKQDVTIHVSKSIQRLYYLFYPGLLYVYAKYVLGLRTKKNLFNAWSTYGHVGCIIEPSLKKRFQYLSAMLGEICRKS